VPFWFFRKATGFLISHLDSIGSGAMQDFKIQNMVGSCDVKFPIRLEGLAMVSGTFANVRLRLRD